MQVTQLSQIHKTFNIQHEDTYMETNTTQYIHVAWAHTHSVHSLYYT